MPLPFVTTDPNPYVLDTVVGIKNEPIAALTRKNADFIQAVLGLDSNYKKDNSLEGPGKGFDINTNFNDSKGKFCGSIHYWFTEMQKPGANYAECLLGAVVSVDRANKTHLETVEDGRLKMRDRILSYYPNLNLLKQAVSVPYTFVNTSHIIYKLTEGGLFNMKDGTEMFFLSFASKFITHASIELNHVALHSKYDGVVSDNLPNYAKTYIGKSFNKTHFKVEHVKGATFAAKRNSGLQMYGEYVETINEILAELSAGGITISRDEFDHVVWYCTK